MQVSGSLRLLFADDYKQPAMFTMIYGGVEEAHEAVGVHP